jgi:hypothetical protein
MKKTLASFFLAILALPTLAQMTPAGLWRGIDDNTGQAKSEISTKENGKVYKLRLAPLDGGKKRQVRGDIGPFYRNQVWQRVQ